MTIYSNHFDSWLEISWHVADDVHLISSFMLLWAPWIRQLHILENKRINPMQINHGIVWKCIMLCMTSATTLYWIKKNGQEPWEHFLVLILDPSQLSFKHITGKRHNLVIDEMVRKKTNLHTQTDRRVRRIRDGRRYKNTHHMKKYQ